MYAIRGQINLVVRKVMVNGLSLIEQPMVEPRPPYYTPNQKVIGPLVHRIILQSKQAIRRPAHIQNGIEKSKSSLNNVSKLINISEFSEYHRLSQRNERKYKICSMDDVQGRYFTALCAIICVDVTVKFDSSFLTEIRMTSYVV